MTFTCGICGTPFPSPQQLGKHARIHSKGSQQKRISLATFLNNAENFDIPSSQSARFLQAPADIEDNRDDAGDNFSHQQEIYSHPADTERISESEESLAQKIFLFYEGFADKSIALWDKVEAPSEISPRAQVLVDFCLRKRMSSSEIEDQYNLAVLMAQTTSQQPPAKCWLELEFENARKFQARVLMERRYIVKSQGWREASIKNKFGSLERGVFLPLGSFISKKVKKHGGYNCIVLYQEELNEKGERIFSKPTDANAMKYDSQFVYQSDKRPVYFSLYADKTMLARCGSADGYIVRIRLDNVLGESLQWHDIGYAPILSVPGPGVQPQVLSEARLELFQRFIHLIMRDLRNPDCIEQDSRNNSTSCNIEPRLLSFNCDQPQERENVCLMRGQSHQDCTKCTFKSLEEREFNRKRRRLLDGTAVPGPHEDYSVPGELVQRQLRNMPITRL